MTDHATMRADALNKLYTLLDKEVGKGAGRPITERSTEVLPRFSTGTLGGDYVSGGGFPRGRVIELFGGESSGKTTLALCGVASAQKAGGTAAFIDAEHSFDPIWAERLGVDVSKMLYHAPDYGEQALEVVEAMVRSRAVDYIVVDSVAALLPLAEMKGDIGDAVMGGQARLMSQAMRKLTPQVAEAGVTLVFINQLREKIGVMFGNPETTTGGKALKFYASVRLELKRIGQIKDGEERIGDTIRVRAVKNKTCSPFRVVEIPLYYNTGFDVTQETIDHALAHSQLVRKGSWYYRNDEQIGQGRQAVLDYYVDNPDKFTELYTEVANFMNERQ